MKKRLLVIAGSFVGVVLYLLTPQAMVWMTIGTLATNFRVGGEGAGISFGIQEIFLYALAVGFVFYKFRFEINPIRSAVSRDIGLYTLVMTITTLMNIGLEPAHMLSVVRDTLAPWMWYLLFLNFLLFAETKNVKRYLLFLMFLGIMSSCVAFLQHYGGILTIYHGEESRDYLAIAVEGAIQETNPATGLFPWFNAYGMFVQISFFICLVFWQFEQTKTRKWYLMGVLLLLLGEYISFSRGSYVTLILGIMIILAFASRKWRITVAFGALFLGTLIAAYVIPFVLQNEAVIATLLDRFLLWQEGMTYFLTRGNWLYGIGPGMFMKLVGTYYDVHNVYLMHLFENGFPGLLVLVWLVFRLLKETYIAVRTAKTREFRAVALICFTVFLGYFLHEMIEHTFYSIVFRMTIFTLAALFVRAKSDEERWLTKQSTISL